MLGASYLPTSDAAFTNAVATTVSAQAVDAIELLGSGRRKEVITIARRIISPKNSPLGISASPCSTLTVC